MKRTALRVAKAILKMWRDGGGGVAELGLAGLGHEIAPAAASKRASPARPRQTVPRSKISGTARPLATTKKTRRAHALTRLSSA